MEQWYELWDAANASLVGAFDTQEAALAVVQHSLATFGPGSVDSLVLTAEDDSGDDPRVLAAGSELVALARKGTAALATGGSAARRA